MTESKPRDGDGEDGDLPDGWEPITKPYLTGPYAHENKTYKSFRHIDSGREERTVRKAWQRHAKARGEDEEEAGRLYDERRAQKKLEEQKKKEVEKQEKDEARKCFLSKHAEMTGPLACVLPEWTFDTKLGVTGQTSVLYISPWGSVCRLMPDIEIELGRKMLQGGEDMVATMIKEGLDKVVRDEGGKPVNIARRSDVTSGELRGSLEQIEVQEDGQKKPKRKERWKSGVMEDGKKTVGASKKRRTEQEGENTSAHGNTQDADNNELSDSSGSTTSGCPDSDSDAEPVQGVAQSAEARGKEMEVNRTFAEKEATERRASAQVRQKSKLSCQDWCASLHLPDGTLHRLVVDEKVLEPRDLAGVPDEDLKQFVKYWRLGPKGRFLAAVQAMREH